MSFGIRGEGLEAEGWSDESDESDKDDDDEDVGTNERTGLVRK
jgi:hypothetical protein|tara:strand:+ start:7998 stop:8126 length:129 start_codon:yes stop_codon:yes gene_type:complete